MKTAKKYAYRKYIQSAEWKQKAEEVKEYYHHTCQRCGGRSNLHVHHWHYKTVGDEDFDEDLTVLCKNCHDWIHIKTRLRSTDIEILVRLYAKRSAFNDVYLADDEIKEVASVINDYLFCTIANVCTHARLGEFGRWPMHNLLTQIRQHENRVIDKTG